MLYLFLVNQISEYNLAKKWSNCANNSSNFIKLLYPQVAVKLFQTEIWQWSQLFYNIPFHLNFLFLSAPVKACPLAYYQSSMCRRHNSSQHLEGGEGWTILKYNLKCSTGTANLCYCDSLKNLNIDVLNQKQTFDRIWLKLLMWTLINCYIIQGRI